EGVMGAVLTVVVVCAAGCGKREQASVDEAPASNVVAEVETFARGLEARAAEAGRAREGVEEFARRAEVETAVAEILGAEKVLTLADVSNRLASLDTEELTRVLVQTAYPREQRVPRGENIMLMYEEVLRRGRPPWTRLMAISVLHDYYRYHHGEDAAMQAAYERVREIARRLTPADAPDKASQHTFANIAVVLCLTLDPPERLGYIDYVEELARQGVIEFPEQPLEMMPLQRAITLLELGRLEEARAVVNEMYARFDSIKDPMNRLELELGPDYFIKSHMLSLSHLYPPEKYPELKDFKLVNPWDKKQ
ncbi:MAG: hypothetical protein N2595_03350, partial [bacterium]|nr:hypothetical protein [bacterium]